MSRRRQLAAALLMAALAVAPWTIATEPPPGEERPLPAMPPGLGAPHFELDRHLRPYQDVLGSITSGEATYPRPLAVLQAEQDVPFTFIADEVMVTPSSPEELERFLADSGGIVLQGPDLPEPPPGSGLESRQVEPDPFYLVKVLAPPPANRDVMAERVAALGVRGALRVSSEHALDLFGLVLDEWAQGLEARATRTR